MKKAARILLIITQIFAWINAIVLLFFGAMFVMGASDPEVIQKTMQDTGLTNDMVIGIFTGMIIAVLLTALFSILTAWFAKYSLKLQGLEYYGKGSYICLIIFSILSLNLVGIAAFIVCLPLIPKTKEEEINQ